MNNEFNEEQRRYEENRKLVFKILSETGLELPKGRELTLETRFDEDLGLESIEAVELLQKIQDKTEVDLRDNIGNMPTVKDVIDALYQRRTEY